MNRLFFLPLTASGLLLLLSLSCHTTEPDPYSLEGGTTVTLQRTGCYGTCPIYTVSVSGTGTGVYVGERFVDVKDTVHFTIAPAQAAAILAELRNVNFVGFDENFSSGKNCPNLYTDMPSQIITLKWGDKTRKVDYYLGCSGGDEHAYQTLRHLGRFIDSVAQTSRWIGQ